jgi:hypothetical protein
MKLQSWQHRAPSTSANCRNKELRLLHWAQAYVRQSPLDSASDCRSDFEAGRMEITMTRLLLASQLNEARKFSRDDRLRSSTPGREAVRPKPPILSHSWSPISFVVVHRGADGDRDYHRAIGIKRRYDERDRRSRAQGCHPAQGAGGDACTQIAERLTSAQLTFSPLSCERRVAGRDANRHVGGISRFQKRARISARCFSRRSPAADPVSRRGSGQGSHLGQGYC